MKTMRGYWVAVMMFSAAMGSALMSRAETAMEPGPQEPGQQEKQTAEMHMMVGVDGGGDGQEAQQKVILEVVAADAQVVRGKAYSANMSTETVQTLSDGNRIVRRTVSKFYRDSDGRTRREQTFGNVDPDHPAPHEVKVFIDDPVSGTAFVLDPGSKSADKMQRTRKFMDERTAGDGGPRILFKSATGDEAAEQGAPGRMMIKFRDEHLANPNAEVMSDEKRETVKEDLGSRNIEGVDCNGTRHTITIPAGALGNERPISIVTETWFAPAIAAVVRSTTDDPRYGKTTYQLTDVQLNEPDRSLFEPPADFKVGARR